MNHIRDRIAELQLECNNFVAKGGNEALFWSGRMAVCVASIRDSNVFMLSHRLEFLYALTEEYNRVIMDLVNKK